MAKVANNKAIPIITSMGLFWKKDLVDWRGQAGKLLGTERGAKSEGEVDFADQVGVYALYADYRLVYIGRANVGKGGCLGRRLKHHTGDHLAGRWDMFSWFGLKRVTRNGLGMKFNSKPNVPWDDLVGVLEGVLIEIAEPPQNSQGGSLRGAKQYLQVPWVNPDEDIARTIKYVSDIARYLREQELSRATKGKPESLLNAAALVLQKAGQPMSCSEIWAKIPKKHTSKRQGKTPVQTLHSAIWVEMNSKGIHSRFRKTERGKYALYLYA